MKRPNVDNLIVSAEPIEASDNQESPNLSEFQYTFDVFRQTAQKPADIYDNQQLDFHNVYSPNAERALKTMTSPISQERQDEIDLLNPTVATTTQKNFDTSNNLLEDGSRRQSNQVNRTKSNNQFLGASLMQFFHIKKFIGKMLWNRKLMSKITNYQIGLINDQASVYSHKIFNSQISGSNPLKLRRIIVEHKQDRIRDFILNVNKVFSQFYHKLEYWESRIPLFYPQSFFKLAWDLLLTLVRVFYMIAIPLQLAFPVEILYGQNLQFISLIFTILLLADLILSFNTPYYQFGQMVTQRKQIAYNTLMKGFGLEVSSVAYLILLLFISDDGWVKLGLVMFIVQFQNITKILRQCEEVLNLSKKQSSILELVKLVFLAMYILHIFSCIWFWCGLLSSQIWGVSWIQAQRLENESWGSQYLKSFYYSTVTMFTVGYGDVTPQSQLETIFSICFMMICSIQLSYSVNTVGAIIDKITKYSEEKLVRLRVLNTYMYKKKISYDLQYQIREYLNYYWESQEADETNEQTDIIEQLSEQLREKLLVEANSILLRENPLFSKVFSPNFMNKIIQKIKSIVIQPENYIDFAKLSNCPQDSSKIYMCIIEKGSIQIFLEDKNPKQQIEQLIKEIGPGSSFGVFGFISGIRGQEKFRSVGFTKLLLICRDDLLEAIKDFPDDKEKLCAMRDDILFNNGYETAKLLNQSCFSCQSNQHRVLKCPIVNYHPDKERVLKTHTFTRDQKRNESNLKRKNKNQFQAIIDQNIIAEVAGFIQNDYWKVALAYEIEPPNFEDNISISSRSDTPIASDSRNSRHSHNLQMLQQTLSTSRNYPKQKLSKKVTLPMEAIDEDNTIENQSVKAPRVLNINRHNHRRSTKLQRQSLSPSLMVQFHERPIEQNPQVEKPSLFHPKTTRSVSIDPTKISFLVGDQMNDKQNSQAKMKFQKVFRFIKSVNKIQSKYKVKEPRFSVDQLLSYQNELVNKVQLKEQVDMMEQRQKKINLFKKHSVEQFEFLYLSVKKRSAPFSDLVGFEHSQSYKHYQSHNNLENVLSQLNQRHDSHLKFIQYLMYPHDFIGQYRNKFKVRTDIKPKKTHLKVQHQTTNKVATYKEILKLRNMARRIITNNSSSSRVAPFKNN